MQTLSFFVVALAEAILGIEPTITRESHNLADDDHPAG